LEIKGRRAEVTALGKDFDKVKAGKQALSEAECNKMLAKDLGAAQKCV